MIQRGSAQFEDVAKAFRRTVLAGDTIVVISRSADVGELEADLLGDVGHGRNYKMAQAVPCIRTLRPANVSVEASEQGGAALA